MSTQETKLLRPAELPTSGALFLAHNNGAESVVDAAENAVIEGFKRKAEIAYACGCPQCIKALSGDIEHWQIEPELRAHLEYIASHGPF